MDIKVERESHDGNNYLENYASDELQKYFDKYPFIESVKVFFRGDKHPSKKVKVQMRLKGKDIYSEGKGKIHRDALDKAIDRIKTQIEKYKSKRYHGNVAPDYNEEKQEMAFEFIEDLE